MNKTVVSVIIVSLLLVMPFVGCVEDKKETTQTQNENNSGSDSEELTDEDWEYYVWQYITRDHLFSQIETGWNIINATSGRNIRLLKVNESNMEKITQLKNISSAMNSDSTIHLENISNFNLSTRLDETRGYQIIILNSYLNISKNYSSIYHKYSEQLSLISPLSEDEYVDIADEITSIIDQSLVIQSNIEIINTKLNNSISDEEYFEWAEGKNTSMFPTS